MVTMHRQNQAALLSLLFMSEVFAGTHEEHHTDVTVYRGDSATFSCNTSGINIKLFRWINGNFLFSHQFSNNLNFSNFSSDRVTIKIGPPSKLIISNVQDNDRGLYICNITDGKGFNSYRWNLTVLQKPEGEGEGVRSSQLFFYYFLLPGIGVFLCCIISAICLCRKLRAKTPNQNQTQDQSNVESAEEQRVTERRRNKRRSQYMERLNSIYNAY